MVSIYSGNLVGSLLIVILITLSGQLNFGSGMLGALTIKTAVYKVNLTFFQALSLGILCNRLVTLAVWLSLAAKDITGKILGISFLYGYLLLRDLNIQSQICIMYQREF